MSSHRILTVAFAGAMALVATAPALAQSDREIYERTISLSADICPGHSLDRTTPGVKAVPVGALRVLRERAIVMCPDRRLDASAPAVFYGRAGVYAWNPEVDGAAQLVASKIDAMTRTEDFPPDTLVWDLKGKALNGQTVPAFEPKPGVRLIYKVR